MSNRVKFPELEDTYTLVVNLTETGAHIATHVSGRIVTSTVFEPYDNHSGTRNPISAATAAALLRTLERVIDVSAGDPPEPKMIRTQCACGREMTVECSHR